MTDDIACAFCRWARACPCSGLLGSYWGWVFQEKEFSGNCVQAEIGVKKCTAGIWIRWVQASPVLNKDNRKQQLTVPISFRNWIEEGEVEYNSEFRAGDVTQESENKG